MIENLTVAKAKPAAKTATPELALAINWKHGSQAVGILIPIKTKITASNGAAATGCLIALITAALVELSVSFFALPS